MSAEGSFGGKVAYQHPFLAGVTQSEAHCAAGRCDMPILYNDSSQLFAFYRVPLDAAAALVGDPRLEPLPLFGKAVAGFAAFEYRDTSAGVYNEIGLTILTRRKGTTPSLTGFLLNPARQPDAAFFVVNLPVTTELARAAGADFWGYPKYVKPISTEFSDDGVKIGLAGELELQYSTGPALSLQAMPIATFSSLGGKLLRTFILTHGRMRLGLGGSLKLKCIGDGPTAHSVRALLLDQTKPFAVCRTEPLRVILPYGVPVD